MSNLTSFLRRQSTLLLFVVLGLVMLTGQRVLLAVTSWINGVPDAPTSDNLTGPELQALKQAGGWVAAGNAGSKFIVAAGFFCLFLFLIWLVQGIIAPKPKAWAKSEYSTEFEALQGYDKFREYQATRWQLIVLAAAAIVGACLIA
jgi:hypothetical protein